jgi:putative effector of murein hydrolase
MTKFKLLTAAAVLSTLVAAPAMGEPVYHHRYHTHGPIGTAAGVAAGVAGAAVGTAAAIADAPFRNSYNYDPYMGPDGYACRPGTWFKGEDGRRHICQ